MATSKERDSSCPLSDSKLRNHVRWEDDDQEAAALLASATEISSWRRLLAPKTSSTRIIFVNILPWVLNFVLLIAIIYLSSRSACAYRGDVSSPADVAVEHVPVVFQQAFGDDARNLSPYQGWPDDEQDRLWEDMYTKGVSIRIDEAEHQRMPNKTERIPIPGQESEYRIGIDVFHQLHCLNAIRKAFYPGRYNKTLKNPDGSVHYLHWVHIDHCIESIRQSLTCSADISPTTFKWYPKSKIQYPVLGTVHVCRNFTKLQKWAFDRYVEMGLGGRRRHVNKEGNIEDYSGTPSPEDIPGVADAPEGWRHNPLDL